MEAQARRLVRPRVPAVSAHAFRRLAWATLVALVAITLSGATVRLTGSGLGCENWPRCGDTFLPPKDFNALVEFGNRALGVCVGLVSLACAVAAWRVPALPRRLVWAATAIVATVALQGILGGITVLTELHPLIVMGHFLLALAAVALAVLLVVDAAGFADKRAAPVGPAWVPWLALALVPVAAVLVVTGAFVTAAGPHSGGADIERLGNLEDAVYVHVRATAVFGVGFLVLVAALFRRRARLRHESVLAGCVLVLLVLQMTVGEIQWRNQLPWWLVLVHVALATAVWAGVVALAARLRRASRVRSGAGRGSGDGLGFGAGHRPAARIGSDDGDRSGAGLGPGARSP